jgi:ABC-type nitrate/sulfonate/bicarbonate transport system substrate-binding protein
MISSMTTAIKPRPLRVGFVPLCDCAPLVMAQELGLFEKHGLKVHLSREVGWATIRDKIIYGDLDAAHALAPLLIATTLGLGSAKADCVTGLVLNLEGNAITLANAIQDVVAHDGNSLLDWVRKRRIPLILGIPFLYSSHYFLTRSWLRSQGLDPARDAQFVVVPPPQMATNLKAGHLDGFCVGEPWNSVAVNGGFGFQAATSADIAPGHLEKVLMVRRQFAKERAEEHIRLISALLEACQFCATPGNLDRVIETLGEPQFINAPAAALRLGCSNVYDSAAKSIVDSPDYEPSAAKGLWLLNQMRECGLLPRSIEIKDKLSAQMFRADILQIASARKTQTADPSNETFTVKIHHAYKT